jgi:membrane-associated phospholipid phosphatase
VTGPVRQSISKIGILNHDLWWNRLLVVLLILPAMLLYRLTNEWVALRGQYTIVKWPLDDLIPFCRWFVLPYYAWYLQIAGTMLWLVFVRRTDRLYLRLTVSIVLALFLSCLVFVVFPTHVPRPDLVGDDNLTHLVRLIYQADQPYNCLPSLHVAISGLLALAWRIMGPRRWWFQLSNVLLLILICLSTVLIKQHYLPDIPSGLAVTWLSWILAGRIIRPAKQLN